MSVDIRRVVELARPVFVRNGWSWCDNPDRPPTCSEMMDWVERLVERAANSEIRPGSHSYVRSGRFRIQRDWAREDPQPELHVLLELGDNFDLDDGAA